jgi:hypothetical protein
MRCGLLSSLAVFTPNPLDATYFLPTAAKSKQKTLRAGCFFIRYWQI